MSLPTLLLGLWVFLQSGSALNWFTVDHKLVAWVGIAFVAVVVYEALTGGLKLPTWLNRRKAE